MFDVIVGLGLPFWVSGKRKTDQGNRFYYDSGRPVVPEGVSKYVISDDTMTRPAEACMTLKANKKKINTYRANSAICTQKKAVICMLDKRLSTTTETTTTTTLAPISTAKPVIPGESLPKMPRFCPPKRTKRNAIGKYCNKNVITLIDISRK